MRILKQRVRLPERSRGNSPVPRRASCGVVGVRRIPGPACSSSRKTVGFEDARKPGGYRHQSDQIACEANGRRAENVIGCTRCEAGVARCASAAERTLSTAWRSAIHGCRPNHCLRWRRHALANRTPSARFWCADPRDQHWVSRLHHIGAWAEGACRPSPRPSAPHFPHRICVALRARRELDRHPERVPNERAEDRAANARLQAWCR